MNWDRCLPNESHIAEVLYIEYKNIVRYTNQNQWEYLNDSNWIVDNTNKIIDNLFIKDSYNKILERIIHWQQSNVPELTKNYMIKNLNDIIKILSTKNKYKRVIKEAISYFAID